MEIPSPVAGRREGLLVARRRQGERGRADRALDARGGRGGRKRRPPRRPSRREPRRAPPRSRSRSRSRRRPDAGSRRGRAGAGASCARPTADPAPDSGDAGATQAPREPVGAAARARARCRSRAACRRAGRKGRILKEDVQRLREGACSPRARPPASRSPASRVAAPAGDRLREVRARPSSSRSTRSARLGANLHRSWVTVPHVTQFDEADVTELEALPAGAARRGRGARHQAHLPALRREGGVPRRCRSSRTSTPRSTAAART